MPGLREALMAAGTRRLSEECSSSLHHTDWEKLALAKGAKLSQTRHSRNFIPTACAPRTGLGWEKRWLTRQMSEPHGVSILAMLTR